MHECIVGALLCCGASENNESGARYDVARMPAACGAVMGGLSSNARSASMTPGTTYAPWDIPACKTQLGTSPCRIRCLWLWRWSSLSMTKLRRTNLRRNLSKIHSGQNDVHDFVQWSLTISLIVSSFGSHVPRRNEHLGKVSCKCG